MSGKGKRGEALRRVGVRDAARWLAAGASPAHVRERLAQEHGVAESTVGSWIREARRRWADIRSEDGPEAYRDEAEQRLSQLYLQAVKEGQMGAARAILRDLNELHGLYDAESRPKSVTFVMGLAPADDKDEGPVSDEARTRYLELQSKLTVELDEDEG